MKYQLIIFLYISLFQNYKATKEEDAYREFCNIQIPDIEINCTELELDHPQLGKINKTINNKIRAKACCFEKFRINKIYVTRCIYLNKTEDGVNDEKKKLKEEWGVKDLTILCSGGNLKFKFLFFLILELLL